MNRRTARENAFIAAFELGFGAQSLEDIIEYSEESAGNMRWMSLPKSCCVAIWSMPHRRTS